MRTFSLTHVADAALGHALDSVVAKECAATAWVLAHIAEFDARRLYLPAGYSSMHAYCVERLPFSEDAAYKRIQAARKAREFPAIFEALAAGRLHLGGVCLLAPHLTPQNADQLLAAAAHQTKSKIERLIAERFPQTEVMALVQPIPGVPRDERLAPGQVGEVVECRSAASAASELAPGQVEAPVPPTRVKPIAAERFAIQFTIGKETNDLLLEAQELLTHAVPSGDLAAVFHRALEALVPKLRKQKFAATSKPRRSCRTSANPRHIPARVKRAVWERDRGRCTFVGEDGHRCGSRKFLEFDHTDPVARGGRASVDGVRLRCRAHNQLEAERAFGAGFMSGKREKARRTTARVKEKAREDAAAERAEELDVVPWLRRLGCSADEARRAASFCESIPDAPLEERVRVALSSLGSGRRVRPALLAPRAP